MPRCGCAETCSCLILAGDGVTVDGIGTIERPYEISAQSSDLTGRMIFDDSATIDFATSGVGSLLTPFHVTADAKVAFTELTDVGVGETPDVGDVAVWKGDHWEFEPPTGGGGGTGLPPGGTDGQVLTKQSSTDGDADWETLTGGGGGSGESAPSAFGSWYRTTTQSIPNAGSYTFAIWDGVHQPASGITLSPDNTTFTVTQAGQYLITARIEFAANATGARNARLYHNGVVVGRWDGPVDTIVTTIQMAASRQCAAGDTLHIGVYQTSGAALNLAGDASNKPTAIEIVKTDSLFKFGEPSARAIYQRRAAFSANNTTGTTVVWDYVEQAATGITYANGVFTCTSPGWYLITARMRFTATGSMNSAAYSQIRINKNGAIYDSTHVPIGTGFTSAHTADISRQVRLAAGDQITVSINPGGSTFTVDMSTSTYETNAVEITRIDGGPALASGGGISGTGSASDPLTIGAPVDCSTETRMCTNASSAANTGSSISYARYTKLGKMVTFWGSGVIGSGVVADFAILIPPSAGTPAFRHQNGAAQVIGNPGVDISGGPLMTADMTKYVFTGPTNVYMDTTVGGNTLRWQLVYEVL